MIAKVLSDGYIIREAINIITLNKVTIYMYQYINIDGDIILMGTLVEKYCTVWKNTSVTKPIIQPL